MAVVLFGILSVLVSFTVAEAAADDVSIEVELSRTQVYVGDDLTMQVLVRGADNPPTPVIDFPSSVRASYDGRSSQSFTSVKVLNGRRQSVTDHFYRFQYTVSPVDAGVIQLPAPVVDIDGHSVSGNETSFDAVLPTLSKTDDLLFEIPRTDIYLNESVEANCTWWISEETSDLNMASSSIPDTFRISPLDPPSGGQQNIRIMLNGEALVATVMPGRHAGKDMTKLVFRFLLTPSKIGDFTLGPIRAVFTRRENTGQKYRAYTESEALKVVVKNVPQAGRPAGYKGAIGSYQVITHALNTSVHVGDPIVLTYQVFGDEPMFGVERAPDLEQDFGFKEQFKVASDGWRETKTQKSGVRVFTTTIRALSDQVTEIPPFGFPTFRPSSGTYEMILSQAIPIDVQTVDVVTLSDAIVTGGLERPSSLPFPDQEHVVLTDLYPSLWAHQSAQELLADRTGFGNFVQSRGPVVLGIAASGPLFFSISWLVVAFRKRGGQRSQALWRAYRKSLKLDRSGHIGEAYRNYVSSALNLNTHSVVSSDAFLLPIMREDATALAEILSIDEMGSVRQSQTPQRLPVPSGLLRSIHRQVLKSDELMENKLAVQS